jgi:probable rRNA maturation factor
MIRVDVKKQSNYPVNVTKVKKELKSFLESKGLVSDFSVSVSFVSEKAMRELAKKFLGEKNSVHNVLTFPESEVRGDFEYPSTLALPLGEIVVCFPEVVREAKKEGKLIDLKVSELVEHGALHLLGEHHE